ncbi:DUF3299 domain-containing protein [Candidatus Pelagadaptatus aseana]|uniref:DUF3299 domain-containing protein n=1 Tax=Candidatus Pelagadaptatus aseana TaxID=3120508 RepID=UPI003C6F828B
MPARLIPSRLIQSALSILTLALFCFNSAVSAPEKPGDAFEFETIEWTDLMPEEDLEALLNPPSYITDIEDGSAEDQISSQLQSTIAAAQDDRYQQALISTNIRPELDGKTVRIPGFIVPLEFNDDEVITEFFLVPFFGACIHVPPPPPNQIIHVTSQEGLKLTALYDPFWISGILSASLKENDMATSAYAIDMMNYEPYTD